MAWNSALCRIVLVGTMASLSAAFHERALANDTECGGPDMPCMTDGGEYFAALPDDKDNPPAVIWLHGFGRSGKMMIQNTDYVDPFRERGYAVIMPSGQPFPGNSNLDWGVDDGYAWPRDDVEHLLSVRDDAIARFDLDPSRILLAGFSRGGSMVWDLACRSPELARGYAAVAGAFWEPMADRCASPVDLFHTHGFNDRLVPFEGRKVHFSGIDFEQGSVMKGINIWRDQNGCMTSAQNSFGEDGSYQKDWPDCDGGSIRLKLTTGGHQVPEGWRDQVLDWFEALP